MEKKRLKLLVDGLSVSFTNLEKLGIDNYAIHIDGKHIGFVNGKIKASNNTKAREIEDTDRYFYIEKRD